MSSNSGSRRSRRDNSREYNDDYYDYDYGYDDRYEDDYVPVRSAGRERGSDSGRGSADRYETGRGEDDYGTESSRKSRSGRSDGRGHRRKEKRRNRMILIIAAVLVVFALVLAFIAVTDTIGSTDYTASTIEFLRNGKVRVTSVEAFDQDYYDAEELEETISEAIAEYGDGVSQEYLDVSDGTAKLVLTYDSAEDYVAFNSVDLFTGTVAEAEEAGYDFQSIMSAVSQEDTSKILTEATLDQLSDNVVIILFEQADIVTYQDMLYATSNLGVTDSTHATAIDTISEDTPAIVILVND